MSVPFVDLVRMHEPLVPALQAGFSGMPPCSSARAVSDRRCATGLPLPMFPGITESELDEVADALRPLLGA